MKMTRIRCTDAIPEGMSVMIGKAGMTLLLRDGLHCVEAELTPAETQQLARAIDGIQDLPIRNAQQLLDRAPGAPLTREFP